MRFNRRLRKQVAILGGKRDPFTSFLSLINSEKVDFVGIGDSNQLLSGFGWDHGFQYALSQSFAPYATGLISANEAGGGGGGQGYLYKYSGGTDVGAFTGAPSDLAKYLAEGLGDNFADYGYLSDDDSFLNNFTGMDTDAAWPGVNSALTARFHYGTFPAGTASVNFQVRYAETPYSTLGQLSVDPVTGSYGMTHADIALTAATRDKKIAAYWQYSGQTMQGPFFGTYVHLIDTAKSAGWSYTSLIANGGGSLYDLSYDLEEQGADSTTHWFQCLRDRQGARKHFCIVINSGLNDRNETETSRGPLAIADGDSAAAYADNADSIIRQINALWATNGWDANELTYLLMPSHPVSDPDDAELVSYRAAAKSLAAGYSNVSFVDISELTDEAEMLAGGWYASGGTDRSHLTQAGYENLSVRVVAQDPVFLMEDGTQFLMEDGTEFWMEG